MESNNESSHGQITIETLEKLEFDIIREMPWAHKLWSNVQDHTKKGFLNWCNIVKKLVGTKADHVDDWSKQYLQTIDETCCDLVYDLVHLQSKTMEKIQDLLGRLEKLCIELHQKMPQKIGDAELSLFEEQIRLMKQINEYETIISSKKKELETLNKKQLLYCKYLGQEPKFSLHYPPIPTSTQLEEFQKHVDQLESEKFERDEKYCLLKEDIMMYVEELQYKPNSDFEKKVLSSDDFLVSLDNLKKLDYFLNSLKEIKKSTEEDISQMRSRIEDLWKMLEVDLMHRDEFRSRYSGNSLDTLEALRREVKRCDEIRKANIKIFVDKLRVQLNDLWKKCQCTDLAKRSFKYFTSDCYTEDLLDLHEIEIQKWKNYYEDNARLLGLLEKHQELWEKVTEFEENATGPNRYKNRGGVLLQEEKERNKLSKMIPKIEDEIRMLSEEYRDNNNGISLTSFGRTPEEYIDHLHAERENARKLKLSARKVQRDNTVGHTPAKSPISLFPSTSRAVTHTPMSGVKRKILATPVTENMKRLKANTPKSAVVKPGSTPKMIPKIKVTCATLTLPRQKRRSRTSLERRKRLENIRKSRRSRSLEKNGAFDCDTTRNTTYTDFQTELSNREQWRSTILPEEVLMTTPAASSSRKRTPRTKTPINVNTPRRTPATYKTPKSRTPDSASKGNNATKLSTCKSNLKLLF